MKKLFAFLLALGMILALSKPLEAFAGDGENWFDDDFPIDIPVAR